jgi:DNA-binding transcriptional ArsR family regulator
MSPIAVFAALAEPTRFRITDMLARQGKLSAGEISGRFNSTDAAISQHLKVLLKAQLVVVEKRSQQRVYQLNPLALVEAEEWLNIRSKQWNDRFDALDAHLKVGK